MCEACAVECDKYSMESVACKNCADACRVCAAACRETATREKSRE